MTTINTTHTTYRLQTGHWGGYCHLIPALVRTLHRRRCEARTTCGVYDAPQVVRVMHHLRCEVRTACGVGHATARMRGAEASMVSVVNSQ